MDPLVTPAWLAAELAAPDLAIADATLLGADTGRDARAEFAAGHLPGAVFLDLADLRDRASPLPNTRPDAAAGLAHLAALGLGAGQRIVLYDASPWRSSARAWWLLTGWGLDAAILDGGLAAWRAAGLPLEIGAPTPAPVAPAPASDDPARWRDLAQVRTLLAAGGALVDARSAARFAGAEADPHGAAPGHVPGSASLPYPRLFGPDGRWLRGAALAAAFRAAGVDPARPFVATCGSGVTAAVLAFGAHLLGTRAAVYDGSWAEWGADPATPKALGKALGPA